MKLSFTFTLLCVSFFVQGQVFINGFVIDTLNQPIVSSEIKQVGVNQIEWDSSSVQPSNYHIVPRFYVATTDRLGAFHLIADTTSALEIEVSAYGFQSKKIKFDELPTQPINIVLKVDTSSYQYNRLYRPRFPTETGMGVDFLRKKFDDFSDILGEPAATQMGYLPLSFTFELAKNYNKVYAGFGYGISFNSKTFEDTLSVENYQSIFSFQLGYRLIDRPKFLLMPQASVRSYKVRVIQGVLKENNTLPIYLQDRNFDLRFYQPVLDLGVMIGFKKDISNGIDVSFNMVGLQVGYPMKLRKTPRINGIRNKINTDRSVELGSFSLGLVLRHYFE